MKNIFTVLLLFLLSCSFNVFAKELPAIGGERFEHRMERRETFMQNHPEALENRQHFLKNHPGRQEMIQERREENHGRRVARRQR